MKLLKCRILNRYLKTAMISEPLTHEMIEHMESCDDCRREWQELNRAYHQVERVIRQQKVPPVDPRAQEALFLRLQQEERTVPPAFGFSSIKPAMRLALPVACAVTLIGWNVARQPGSESPIQRTKLSYAVSTVQNGQVDGVQLDGLQAESARQKPFSPAPTEVNASAVAVAQRQPPFHSAQSPSRLNRVVPVITAVQRKTAVQQERPIKAAAVLTHDASRQQRPESEPASSSSATQDDLEYINEPVSAAEPELEEKVQTVLNTGDDFITVPRPQIAAVKNSASPQLIAAAVKRYEEEQKVVDPRLFRKVDVQMKGGDLKELVGLLTQKTGVPFYVNKEIEDIKLTVLVKQIPVRDLMRQIVRLFNLEWRRTGEEGNYRYSLVQTLRQKLIEEELRRKDEDQMLLNMADSLEMYLPYKDTPKEELQSLVEEAKLKASVAGSVEERRRLLEKERILYNLMKDEYRDALKLTGDLTPDQWVALGEGQKINFSFKGDGSENGLPKEIADRLYESVKKNFPEFAKVGTYEETTISVGFDVARQRPDQTDLRIHWEVGVPKRGRINFIEPLLGGRPDRLRDPGNSESHADYNGRPAYKTKIALEPKPAAAASVKDNPYIKEMLEKDGMAPGAGDVPLKGSDWVDAGEILEELHKKSGRNILADHYTRVYPRSAFHLKEATLLDALNQTADALFSDWQEENGILRFRRFNYYSERTMDVPNSSLRKWESARKAQGHLRLSDLAEIAILPQDVLNHPELSRAVMLKFGLDEWPLASSDAKRDLIFFAMLTPTQQQWAQSEGGLPLRTLNSAQAEHLMQTLAKDSNLSWEQVSQGIYLINLMPPGCYAWFDWTNKQKSLFPPRNLVHECSREKLVAEVEARIKSRGASPEQVERAKGDIRGPGAIIWVQAQVGDRYIIKELFGRNGRTDSGTLNEQKEKVETQTLRNYSN